MSDGQPLITGASSSVTVTLKVQVAMLAPSVAVQVTVVWPTEKVLPLAGEQLTLTTPAQLSRAVGAVQLTTAPHLSASVPWAMSDGQPLITGASSSVTVTLKVQVAMLAPSVAVQVTVVLPTEKVLPLAGEQLTLTRPAQLSRAVEAVQLTTAPHLSASVPWAMSAGQPLITGASSSVTVTLKVQVAMLAPSVAVQVTVVWPTEKVLPLAGEQLTLTTPAQLSRAVGAVQLTTAPHLSEEVPVGMADGQPLFTGASSSVQSLVVQLAADWHTERLPPLAGEQLTLTTPAQLSRAVGAVQLTTAPH